MIKDYRTSKQRLTKPIKENKTRLSLKEWFKKRNTFFLGKNEEVKSLIK